jgi:hypothetical protein
MAMIALLQSRSNRRRGRRWPSTTNGDASIDAMGNGALWSAAA